MKEKILAALKTKFANLGFSEKTLEQVAEYLGQTVTDEKGIEPAVTGAENLLKAFQGDIDKRVTTLKTELDTLKKQKPVDPPKPTEPPKPVDDIPQWARDMQAKLEAYEKKESQANLSKQLRDKLKEKGVTESFLKRTTLTVENESEIDKLAGEIEADFVATKQELINQGLVTESPKRASEAEEKAEIDSYLKEKFPDVKN